MATLFLETFGGSGAIVGRLPDIGPRWGNDGKGVISGGGLHSVLSGSTHAFAGEWVQPRPAGNSKFKALTFRINYTISGSAELSFGLSFFMGLPGNLIDVNYRSTGSRLTGFTGASPAPELVRPGSNEVIQTMNFITRRSALYANGVLVNDTPLPDDNGEISYTPYPDSDLGISLYGYGAFGTGQSLQAVIQEIELTDTEYFPAVGEFWTNMIRAAELP